MPRRMTPADPSGNLGFLKATVDVRCFHRMLPPCSGSCCLSAPRCHTHTRPCTPLALTSSPHHLGQSCEPCGFCVTRPDAICFCPLDFTKVRRRDG